MTFPESEYSPKIAGPYDVITEECKRYPGEELGLALDGLTTFAVGTNAFKDICRMNTAIKIIEGNLGIHFVGTNTPEDEEGDVMSQTMLPTDEDMFSIGLYASINLRPDPIQRGATLGLHCVRGAYGDSLWRRVRTTQNPLIANGTMTMADAYDRMGVIDNLIRHVRLNPDSRLNRAGMQMRYEFGSPEITDFQRGFGYMMLLARHRARTTGPVRV